jgi:glycosyltransferase involved in cell wall biosynthesis
MTESTEPARAERDGERALDAAWRAARERAQEAALPSGRAVVSCTAPLGSGGLGRHFKELADAFARRRQPVSCISGAAREHPLRGARRLREQLAPAKLLARAPLPLARPWGTRAMFAEFDRYAARLLPDADHLIAFNGQAFSQLQAARRAGYDSASLISANSHLRHVVRQHELARRQYPLERSWAERLVGRNLAEYDRADRIYVASQYTRQSFLDEGVPDERLSLFPFTPDPRYAFDARSSAQTFDVVYIGSLLVSKGVPLLVDAVRRLAHGDLRLVLIGGWSTPGMRRFIEAACAQDSRISVRPGDPLPHLRAARLCVHASYEDGFAYAPAEALAGGVPVIVSEDTGMKELIASEREGLIVPTGELETLSEAIDAAYRGEVLVRGAARSSDD